MPEVAGDNSPQQSFAERKAAQLRQERAASGEVIGDPVTPEAPDQRAPSEEDGISEDVEQSQGLYADEEDDQELEGSSEALEDEEPSDEDQEEDERQVDWEKRYKDLQSETQSMFEKRGEMDQEHAASMAKHLQVRYELEDTLQEAVQRAEYMRNVMAGNAQQYQNINWSQVPADKVQEVQAQAQQAYAMAQQADQVWNQISQETQQKRELIKQREAEIAKTRLKRTIPNWGNEVYSELRDFAASAGMPEGEFNEITNPVIIEALHAYKQLKSGASGMKKMQTTRKSQTPRGKAARRQPRDDRGQFARKQTQPNQRGTFADKHKHRLAMERQGR